MSRDKSSSEERPSPERKLGQGPAQASSQASSCAIVIPAYQGGEELIDCLRSVVTSERQPDVVFVVDNQSTDGSIERASQLFPTVRFLRNDRNRGFGAACNQGLERALDEQLDFVLLLNQDARLEPGTLGGLLEFADAHPQAGVIGPKTLSTTLHADGSPLLLYNGSWRRWYPLWQRIPGIGGSSRHSATQPFPVDYVWGHGLLLRLAAVLSVGMFDPGFFMYYEDLDLCERMQAGGWQIWCDAQVCMYHSIEDGPRATRSDLRRWRQKAESARYYCQKRYPWGTRWLAWIAATVREMVALLVNGQWRAARHVAHAWLLACCDRHR
jgi:N-acetylglucosaminyl-diphospho-decaprenol L-rhamnosyltransferase